MEQDPVAEKQLQGHKAGVTCLAFNPRDKSIASGDSQNVVMVWNLKKSATALKLKGHTGPVLDLNFSPKTNLLASASQDRSVRLWVPTYSGHSTEFRAHFSAVRSVHFSPDGEKLVTGSDDKSVKLWSLEGNRRFISSMSQHSNWVRCTRFSPMGNLVGSCSDDCSAVLWDIRDPKKPVEMLDNLESSPQHLAFQPGNETVFALAFASGHVRIYDMRGPQHLLQTYQHNSGQVNQIAFHPSGRVMISGSANGEIKVLDLMEGRPIYTLSLHKGAVTGVAFSPGGQLFASCGEDRQVIVWRANDSCPSPRTPSSVPPSSGPRTPVSGDPRSPMVRNQGWRNLSNPAVGVTNGLRKTAIANGHAENKSAETIKALEERVRRLEALLQVSPRAESADSITDKQEPLSGLETRILNMEERLKLDDSTE